MSNASNGWIGVDLDGTLAYYDLWRGPLHIGKPIPAMVDRVKEWIDAGQEVRIFTARISSDDSGDVQLRIEQWCNTYLGQPLAVTCRKDYAMIALYDDRCIQVERNTGRLIGDDLT